MKRRSSGASVLALAALVLLSSCATGPDSKLLRRHVAPSPLAKAKASAVGFFGEQEDAFQQVQEACGLKAEALHPVGAALSLGEARRLWGLLMKAPVTSRSFGPRLTLSWLLRELFADGAALPYEELLRRTERFWHLVVVRPDGYLVSSITGKPVQRMGEVTLEEGVLKVGPLLVGDFYLSRGGVFYPVDDSLRQSDSRPWGELGLERDWLNAALDGVQDAVEEMALALAQFIKHPIRSVDGLSQLPSTVAHLIASSPEYFARYSTMPLQDQIREAARLSTHLLTLYGGMAGTVGKFTSTGARMPVLSVSAEGTLVVREMAMSTGTATTTLGAGPGAVSILHMAAKGRHAGSGGSKAGKPPPPRGPGKWVHKTPTTDSPDALRYQEQITKRPASQVYEIDGVEFDGFTGKELLEAKGPGYSSFFDEGGLPEYWYEASGSLNQLLQQARNQSEIARRVGLPLRWHVAEVKMVENLRRLFDSRNITGIDVVFTQPAR